MKKYIIILLVLVNISFFYGCEKGKYYDTGLAQSVFDGDMFEYLKSNPDNWDSLVMMIQRAGLESLFKGKDPAHPQITLFGCTNHSILKYLFENVNDEGNPIYKKIEDIPVETCRNIILSYLIPERKMLDSFEYEIKEMQENGAYFSTGGSHLKTLANDSVRIYRIKTSYQEIPDIGPDALAFQFVKSGHIGEIASCNIQTANGVVHSFFSDFTMTENEGIDNTENK